MDQAQYNAAAVRRFYEQAMNQRNPAVLDSVLAQVHVALGPVPVAVHRDQVKRSIAATTPDWQYEVLDLVADQEKVAARLRLSFLHQTPINQNPPTGRRIQVHLMSIFRLASGLIEEIWEVRDNMSLTIQTQPQPTPGASVWQETRPLSPAIGGAAGHGPNVAAIRRYQDELNRKNVAVLDAALSPSFVAHGGYGGVSMSNRETMKAHTALMFAAFPDLLTVIDDVVSAGSRVAVRTTTTGTQTGQFDDLPPTGRRIHMRGMSIYEIEGGQISAHWGVSEAFEMLRQLRGVA